MLYSSEGHPLSSNKTLWLLNLVIVHRYSLIVQSPINNDVASMTWPMQFTLIFWNYEEGKVDQIKSSISVVQLVSLLMQRSKIPKCDMTCPSVHALKSMCSTCTQNYMDANSWLDWPPSICLTSSFYLIPITLSIGELYTCIVLLFT